jgi:hypothetical protein
MRKLHHHRIDLPEIKDLREENSIEVWDDEPEAGNIPHIILNTEGEYNRLTANEARVLAALLINAAEHQDRRTALSSGGSNHG